MKLNNGVYEVDTSQAEMVARGEFDLRGDGYGHETRRRFSVWKSTRSDMYFTLMEYEERIALMRLFRRPVTGTTLVAVYGNNELPQQLARYDIPTPEHLLRKA